MCTLPLSRAVPLAIVACTLSVLNPVNAQGTADFRPGKIYVIRVSPYFADLEALSTGFSAGFDQVLQQNSSLLAHVSDHFHPMRKQDSGRWFLGYFHPDRQVEEKLLQDMDLMIWLLHGHDVQILPIELTCSPVGASTAINDDR